MSKPQQELYDIVCKLYGKSLVVSEYTLGDGTRIDVAVPFYRIALEYHGRQHFQFVEHFHKNEEEFIKAVARDVSKKTACLDAGWRFVEFSYKDILTEALVVDRIINTEHGDETEALITKGQQHKDRLRRASEYRKARYREWKNKQRTKYDQEE